MACRARTSGSLALLALCLAVPAAAQDETCAPVDRPTETRLLRQRSLDLLGRIPTEAEYAAVLAGATADDALGTMMASDDFFATMRDYHRALLWDNVDADELTSRELQSRRLGDGTVWIDGNAARVYRGAGQVGCIDIEHTLFDGDGHARPLVEGYTGGRVLGRPAPDNAARCAGVDGGCDLDGWVRVHPYWAPEEEIRVCAFDAQTAARGLGAQDCVADGLSRGCGCGPALERCVGQGPGSSADVIADALEEEPLRIFTRIMREPSASYFEALTTRTTEINGPMATYYRHMGSRMTHDGSMATVPELPFEDRTFRSFERSPEHTGVLTTRAFLTRFASHRARANRFSTAFLCEPFVAPSDGLPPSDDECSRAPNLAERCGCETCHARLEPLAVHWGRWDINGSFGFFPSSEHPTFDPSCASCEAGACSDTCDAYYVTRTVAGPGDEVNLGTLSVLAWRTDTEAAALDVGPSALVGDPAVRERMGVCSARTLAERYLHRELTTAELTEWVPALATAFRDGGERLQTLIEAIVRDPRYLATR